MHVIAIDPGKTVNYVAVFRDGRLVEVTDDFRGIRSNLAENPTVYLELMRWRPNDRRSNANDLIEVATNGALFAGGLGGEVKLVPATDWKGSVPKRIMGRRIWGGLVEEEKKIVENFFTKCTVPKGLQHNYIDAIGIGLWASKRL